jgi:hypothetical protein
MMDTKEEYEKRFIDYKKEILDSIKPFVANTTRQLKTVNVMDSIRSSVSSNLEAVRTQIGGDLHSLRTTPSA